MFGISVTSTPAECPNCGFSTKDNIGTCPRCGSRLMQTEEILEKENAFDNGKIVMISSVFVLLYIVLVNNPIPARHLSGPPGVFPSIVMMGCAAGFITGFILMLLRTESKILMFGLIAAITAVLTVVDRLILISFF